MRASLGIAVALGVLLSPAAGSAQIDGKVKLGLDVNMFTLWSVDSGGPQSETQFDIGPFAPAGEANQALLSVPPSGLDIGYGVSDSVLVGARLRLGVSTLENGGNSESIGTIAVMPHVDIVFSPGSSFRPYVGVVGGIAHTASGSERTLASVGLEGGGIGFIGDSFSLGPRVAVTYNPGLNARYTDISILAVQLQLELAGWI